MNGWMDQIDGWMDRWVDGWVDGGMDGWMDGQMDIDRWINGWMDGQDGWMGRCIDRWLDRLDGQIDVQMDGQMIDIELATKFVQVFL